MQVKWRRKAEMVEDKVEGADGADRAREVKPKGVEVEDAKREAYTGDVGQIGQPQETTEGEPTRAHGISYKRRRYA